jgi:hypothetical protein
MPSCFVIMPITMPPALVERYGGDEDHFLHVFEFLFTPALAAAGYDVVSPVASGSDLIQAEIIRNLDEADIALCDMTSLNANVFFELGIRTALNKPVATVRDTFTERIPFDHSMVNCHEYRWEMDAWVVREEIPRLAAHVRACVERGGETNTLWKRLGIEATAQVGSAGTSDEDKFDYIIRQIDDLRADLRRPVGTRPALPAGRRASLVIEADLDAVVTQFLLDAWTIAQEINATFAAYQPGPGRIVLDFGRNFTTEDQQSRLKELADSVGFEVGFAGERHPDAVPTDGRRIARRIYQEG